MSGGFWQWVDSNITPYLFRNDVATTLGTILGWLGAPGDTIRQKLFNLLACFVCGIYGGQLAIEHFHITSQAGQAFWCILLAAIGSNLVSKGLSWITHAEFWDLVAVLMRLKKPEAPTKPSESDK